jgi:hypothetical protein
MRYSFAMRSTRWLVGSVLSCALAVSGVTGSRVRAANAQTPSELAAAQRWFAEGLAFEGAGKWKDALERFRRVAAVKHTPQVDFHVGLGEEHVGELVAAMVDLRRALDAATSQHVATVERAASSELEQLRPRVPHLQLVVPPAATVTRVVLDERSIAVVALAEPIAVDPGPHVVTVSFASGDVTRKTTLEERRAVKLAVEPPAERGSTALPAPPAPASTDAAPSPSSATSADSVATGSERSAVPGWILVGAGSAAIAGGAVFWAFRGQEISTLDAACGADGAHCPASVKSSYDSGKTDSALGIALFATGAAAVGGGVLWIVTRGKSEPTGAALVPVPLPGGGGASLSAHF